MLYTDFIFMLEEEYSRTSTNGHLSTTAFFLVDSQYIHSFFILSMAATSLQWPLSSVPNVAIVERFNCRKVLFNIQLSCIFLQDGILSPYQQSLSFACLILVLALLTEWHLLHLTLSIPKSDQHQ